MFVWPRMVGTSLWPLNEGPSCVHIVHIGVVQVEQGVACCCLTHHQVAPHRNMHTIVRIFNRKFLKSLLQETSFNHSLQACLVDLDIVAPAGEARAGTLANNWVMDGGLDSGYLPKGRALLPPHFSPVGLLSLKV